MIHGDLHAEEDGPLVGSSETLIRTLHELFVDARLAREYFVNLGPLIPFLWGLNQRVNSDNISFELLEDQAASDRAFKYSIFQSEVNSQGLKQ